MGWTERQRAMLAEMGIRWWSAAGTPAPMGAAETAADEHGDAETGTDADADAGPRGATGAPTAPPTTAERAAPTPAPAPTNVGDRPAAPTAVPRAAATVAPVSDAAVAQMDWPALRAAVSGCRACGLCEGRTQTVFGVGHEQADWMIVGEAPGEQEDLQGEPFVGPAGQLLDAMLHALSLTREPAPAERQVFIANTLKCRPPRNRNPEPEEMARCEPFLVRQIELVRPKLILAMGRFAVQALLRSSEPVGKLRGRVHQYHGVPLVVTYHPAYLLRNPADKARAWDDLCLAAQVVERAKP